MRHEAYLGVLVDDLITHGTKEPYRMFTSRAEHRLLLREDNADARLTAIGRKLGLISDARWEKFEQKQEAIAQETARLQDIWATPNNAIGKAFMAHTDEVLTKENTLLDLLKRPNITFDDIAKVSDSSVSNEVGEQIEIAIKYAGYIDRQNEEIAQMKRLEDTALPLEFDYASVSGLSNEIIQKLSQIRPATLGQASRISGVTPAAISLLGMTLKKQKKSQAILDETV